MSPSPRWVTQVLVARRDYGPVRLELEVDVRGPDVVVVGAQKAATTGLLRTLARHPTVVTPRVQEATVLHAGRDDWPAWVGKYEPHLATVPDGDLVVVKLATAMYFPDTVRTIRELNSTARVIAVLRHPVDRMLSLHRYATQQGLETRPPEEALREDKIERAAHWRLNTYSGGSRYANAITTLHKVFEREHVLFLDYADAFASSCLDRTQTFIGLGPLPLTAVRANESRSPRSGALARATNTGFARVLGRSAVPARWRETVRGAVHSLNTAPTAETQQSISADLRTELLHRHAVDMEAAEAALGRPLPEWAD